MRDGYSDGERERERGSERDRERERENETVQTLFTTDPSVCLSATLVGSLVGVVF